MRKQAAKCVRWRQLQGLLPFAHVSEFLRESTIVAKIEDLLLPRFLDKVSNFLLQLKYQKTIFWRFHCLKKLFVWFERETMNTLAVLKCFAIGDNKIVRDRVRGDYSIGS